MILSEKHSSSSGCLPNPDKNESVLKAFAIYAIKNHKQSLVDSTQSSILNIFKQATSDGIKSKECYALAVSSRLLNELICIRYGMIEWNWSDVARRSSKGTETFSNEYNR